MNTPLTQIGQQARQASRYAAGATTAQKNDCLANLITLILKNESEILANNLVDIQRAKQAGLSEAMLDRLKLSPVSMQQMIEGLRQIIALPDPIGSINNLTIRPTGISVGQMRVPLGVIGIIYESRPNVTIDAAGLCIKSGNAAVLRGGSEAISCNSFLAQLIQMALEQTGLPKNVVQLITNTDRALVTELVQMFEFIDVIVPRGGKELITRLMSESKIPMIKHLDGICHVYVDANVDLVMANKIVFNAKCQRYGTCNTMENLVIHEAVLADFLPVIAPMFQQEKVELRADPKSYSILKAVSYPYLERANDSDWETEYLASILAIKTATNFDEAIAFINQYSSKHTDSIVTTNHANAMRFLREVDSASVMVNASTRFADGFEYGLGAEIGISNDKLHARGPVGLEGLTSLKYVVLGDGQIRT